MVDVQQAAATATDYLINLYPQLTLLDVQLEEVELTEDEKYWLITLSYPLLKVSAPSTSLAGFMPFKKDYKVFKIESDAGRVRSMKIRKLD
ncbi:MAG TPA: hypothetical protein VF297_11320 [Pyrinomonadaceae bacterium]